MSSPPKHTSPFGQGTTFSGDGNRIGVPPPRQNTAEEPEELLFTRTKRRASPGPERRESGKPTTGLFEEQDDAEGLHALRQEVRQQQAVLNEICGQLQKLTVQQAAKEEQEGLFGTRPGRAQKGLAAVPKIRWERGRGGLDGALPLLCERDAVEC